ncbi:unnamed protein product [Phytophthora fragariaefolia]|uniref:Unnamed protein product n=1 Tax=Phytophthora fragariaefolia TaxID=1490495 RepID=A0A9W6XMV3_9STRA|nr:unnamed protein product [Phytophthora fragariaefolia]
MMFNRNRPSEWPARDAESLRRKFMALKNTWKPTGIYNLTHSVLDDMVESLGGSMESSCASSPSPGGVGDEAQLRGNSEESEHSAEASGEYTDCDAPCCIAEAPHGAGPAAFSASTRNCTTLTPAKQGASGGYRTN